MKVVIRELEIELEGETPHEIEALRRLRNGEPLTIKKEWEPKNKVIFVLRDPNNWGT